MSLNGDVNEDGAVNAADIVEVVNFIIGNQSERTMKKRADVNGDGMINVADVVTLVNDIKNRNPLKVVVNQDKSF